MINRNNPNIEVITEGLEWQRALSEVSSYDCYHTPDYHNLSKLDDENAVLLKYTEGSKIILFPILIRKISGTKYFDATSVYGYAGPLQKNIDAKFNNQYFNKALNDYFCNEKIISVFSRLNPFIQYQDVILQKNGEIKNLGDIVNIDLNNTLEEQRVLFSKTTKRYLNKAKKALDVKICSNDEWLSVFIELYYENMKRVKAQKQYYFTEEYFYNLLKSNNFKVNCLFAIHKETNQVISAALMIKTNNIIQYHLSGTKNEYLHLSPMRFIINEMRIKGTHEKFKYFNLGGGLGNSKDDLFRFKSSFSKDFKTFKTWNLIVNKEIYNQLVNEKCIKTSDNIDFFPLYRSINTAQN